MEKQVNEGLKQASLWLLKLAAPKVELTEKAQESFDADLEDYVDELANLKSMYISTKSQRDKLERDVKKLQHIPEAKYLKKYRSEEDFLYDQKSLESRAAQMAEYVSELEADLAELKQSRPNPLDYI